MHWDEKCLLELTHHNMFETTDHRSRFHEILNCYYRAPFFSKGLCKCMYLSTWDELHFVEMLGMLNLLTIEGSRDLAPMSEEGMVLSEQSTGADAEIYKLSTAFVDNKPYITPDLTLLDSDTAHIIRQALIASKLIDDLPDEFE